MNETNSKTKIVLGIESNLANLTRVYLETSTSCYDA